MRRMILFLAALLFAQGCAYLGYVKDPFTDIPNFRQVDQRLYRGGQPKDAGWARLSELRVRTVVSLRGGDTAVDDAARAERLGMRFYSLPMTVFAQPSEEQVLSFLDIVLRPENQPVFVHCESGRDRTGAMVAMYRVVVHDWTIKQAYREAVSLGFWPYHGDEAPLKAFVHQLKDKPQYFDKARSPR